MIEPSSLSIKSLPSDKVELEYASDKHFYLYAYPEHRFSGENIDISEFQDLYDAGYSDELINILGVLCPAQPKPRFYKFSLIKTAR